MTGEETGKTPGDRIDRAEESRAPNVLAIETAGDACSVAVIRGGDDRASATTLRPRSHAEQLVPMAVRVVDAAGLRFDEIDVVAVSSGPGSYTGLRIGVSTAKGFARAHGANLVGVPSLQAHAHSVAQAIRLYGDTAHRIAIALTARQSEIYFALFDTTGWPRVDTVVEACVVETAEAAEILDAGPHENDLIVAGDAAEGVVGVLDTRQVDTWKLVPSALSVATLGRQRALAGHFDDIRQFEPHYLKDYVAGISRSVFERLTP